MSTRLLLTLLALLTGLAAQAAPADARMLASGKQEVGAVSGVAGQTRQGVAVGMKQLSAGFADRRRAAMEVVPVRRVLPKPLSVHTGIDRARE